METVKHEIPPVYDKNSKILILGSFPSVKSRENQFFYHHPQNRFWKVLSGVVGCDIPVTIDDKKEDIGSVTFVDKVKNIQPPKKQPVKKGVYEDHYILRYVKYAIVIVIVIAIICVLGYSFIFTNLR